MAFTFAPGNIKASLDRLLAPRTLVVLLALAGVTTAEFRFDWIESAIGNYLVTTNPRRPESGTGWEQGRQSAAARQALNQFTSQRSDVQREALQATTMGQVVNGITDDRGAMISAARFVALYLKLPPVLSRELVSPYALLTRLSNGQWQRTFFQRRDQQLSIYLLDPHSQVLLRIEVAPGLVELIQRGEVAIETGLDQLSDFSDGIYPADRFFNALNSLPAEIREGVIAHPEELLRINGRIVRVGISNQASGDAVDLGFEVEEAGGTRVVLTPARTRDVRRLQWALDHRDRLPWQSGEGPP